MGAVYFYHMTRTPLEVTLPALLEKSLAAGWHVLVRTPDAEAAARLDELLWIRPEDGFLPHGIEGGEADEAHPVLISSAGQPGAREALVSVEGAVLDPKEVQATERAMVLFDGRDEAALEHARGQWRTLTAAGCSAQYWSQESGAWEKKAESG